MTVHPLSVRGTNPRIFLLFQGTRKPLEPTAFLTKNAQFFSLKKTFFR